VSDLYREWAFHGGIPETGFSRFIDDLVKKTWPGCELDEMDTGRREHPFLDDYWQGLHGNLADIKVPLYVCASWSTHGTHTRGTIEGFRQASSKYKWLEVHGRKEWETYYARDVLERQLRFCNFFLKGEENDWLDTPRVRYEARDRFYDGPTKFSDVWPLRETHYKELYLDGEGSVLKDQPIQAPREVAYDPMAPNTDAGRAVFTYKFDVDTELSGYFKLKLWVEADGADDMDLFIGLRKLDRRGRELHFPDFNHVENGIMAHGWLRVSHRELDPERTTVYQPWLKHQRELKLKPGEIVPVEIEIWPSSTLFHAGEALRLEVQGGQLTYTRSSPLPRQHGRVGSSHDELVNAGRHIIHCGGEFDSHLLVPTIPSSR
jgi:putative CocE/NonD family hydrolase